MIDAPLITIGLPTFNRPEGLRSTLKCFLNQTYKNLEIIISDNCSSVDVKAYISDLLQDPRVKFFRQSKNLGVGGNGHFLWSNASGKYFVLASDDDWWHQDFVQTLFRGLASDCSKVISFCDFWEVNENFQKVATLERFTLLKRLIGRNVRYFPDHLPLLRSFDISDKTIQLTRFIHQPEIYGKSNIHRGLMNLAVLRESLDELKNLNLNGSWGWDNLLVFSMLKRGGIFISDKILFKCVVGNVKQYKDDSSYLFYILAYQKLCKASNLDIDLNFKFEDSTLPVMQQYKQVINELNLQKKTKAIEYILECHSRRNYMQVLEKLDLALKEGSVFSPTLSNLFFSGGCY